MAHITEAPVLQIDRFYTGLYTFRNPLVIPVKLMGRRMIELYDAISAGSNMELTNLLTLKRRPGYTSYNSNALTGIPLAFYSFKPSSFPGQVFPVVDCTDSIQYVQPGAIAPVSVFAKSNPAQTNFCGIGGYLYMGNPFFSKKWDGPAGPQGVTNWGIAIGSQSNATGPDAPGKGVDVAASGSISVWANPGNITANDGAFATTTVNASGSNVSQGPSACTSVASGGWSNPTRIEVQDGSYATVSILAGNTSGAIQASAFGFSVPATATIAGIQASIIHGDMSGNGSTKDGVVMLLKAGTPVGSNRAQFPVWGSPPETYNYGSTSDLWGTTWTPADINNSGFGIEISAHNGDINTATAGIDFISLTVTYTLPSGTNVSDYLQASQFGFGIPGTSTITGIQVDVKGLQTQITGAYINVQMLKAGVLIGNIKTGILPASNGFISFGGAGDLWGTTWTPNDINQTTFGISIQGANGGASNTTYSGDFARITVFGIGGPTVTTTTGSLTTQTGYQYEFCYGNSNSGHVSSPTPPSSVITLSTQAALVTLTASTDPQVNQIRVGRTTDGGGQPYFELPTSPYPNIQWAFTSVANASAGSTVYTGTPTGASGFASSVGQTFIVAGFTNGANNGVFTATAASATTLTLNNAGGVAETHAATGLLGAVDNSPDNTLQIANILPIPHFNDPPPAGLVDPVWFSGRLWGHVGNLLYFASGPDITMGNGQEAWYPVYVFALPTTIIRKFPLPNGMLVVTVDDIFVVRGVDTTSFTVNEFMRDNGMRNWNGADTDGSNVYIYTTDRQMLLINANGLQSISGSISDVISNVDPSVAYVSIFRFTAKNTLLFLGDGTTNLYPYNLNLQAWCPIQTPNGGVQAIGSIETQPGVYNFLRGKPSMGQTVAQRALTTFSDEGSTYTCSATIGPIPFADCLTLAQIGNIVLRTANSATSPVLSVLANEISGNFQQLAVQSTEPPELSATPSQSFTANRYTWKTTTLPEVLNFIMMQISWASAVTADEVYSYTIGGTQTTGGSALGAPGQVPQLQGI